MGGNYGKQSSFQRSRTKTKDYTPGQFRGGFRDTVADQATNLMNTGGPSFGDYAGGGFRQQAPQPVNTAQFFTPGQGLKEQMGGMSTTDARNILAGGQPQQGGGGGQFDPYVAQMTPGEQYGLGQVQGQAYGAPLDQPSTQLLGNAISGQYLGPQGVDQAIAGANLGETIGGKYLSPESNPYLQSTLDSALNRAQSSLMDQFGDIQRSDRAAFARAGQNPNASSPFAMARARAGADTKNALGNATSDITAQILGGNYQAERGRQLAAQGQYAGLQGQQYGQERAMQMGATDQATQQAQSRLMNAMRGLESAGLPRMIKDVGIERGLQDFQFRQNQMMNALGLGGQLASPTLGSTSKSKGTSSGVQMGGGLLTS